MRIIGDTPDESVAKTEKVAEENSERRTCPLSKKMIEALVEQMGVEQSNHNLYHTFSNYYKAEGLTKLQSYYSSRASEELEHYNWIRDYLEYNDAVFTIPQIELIDVKIKDRVFPFKATVDREIQTTIDIFKIMDLAQKEGDYFTAGWLYGSSPIEGKLIPEQIEEESLSRQVLKIAELAGDDWLDIQDSVLEYYHQFR